MFYEFFLKVTKIKNKMGIDFDEDDVQLKIVIHATVELSTSGKSSKSNKLVAKRQVYCSLRG